jgi:uncharacterized protein (TIGR01777 family)
MMRVLISGASGLVGTALGRALLARGDQVVRLVRPGASGATDAIPWDPVQGILSQEALAGMDAVVHLAGESVASGRWTASRKARIRESRVQGTALIASRLAALNDGPRVLVSASAIGFYGNRGDTMITEADSGGTGFLAEVCQAWEAATASASDAGLRVVHLRIGLVLSATGGALPKMLTPFRLGLGGPLGDGRMWMSWIHIDDLVRGILHALDTEVLQGPVNALAPEPVTNRDFTTSLGKVLGRPTVLPMPAPLIRLALGEMGDALLLNSLRGYPDRLLSTGFQFTYPSLEAALRALVVPGSGGR